MNSQFDIPYSVAMMIAPSPHIAMWTMDTRNGASMTLRASALLGSRSSIAHRVDTEMISAADPIGAEGEREQGIRRHDAEGHPPRCVSVNVGAGKRKAQHHRVDRDAGQVRLNVVEIHDQLDSLLPVGLALGDMPEHPRTVGVNVRPAALMGHLFQEPAQPLGGGQWGDLFVRHGGVSLIRGTGFSVESVE